MVRHCTYLSVRVKVSNDIHFISTAFLCDIATSSSSDSQRKVCYVFICFTLAWSRWVVSTSRSLCFTYYFLIDWQTTSKPVKVFPESLLFVSSNFRKISLKPFQLYQQNFFTKRVLLPTLPFFLRSYSLHEFVSYLSHYLKKLINLNQLMFYSKSNSEAFNELSLF